MKIAMLGWEFPPFMAGGLGIHCLELTERLARTGHEIDFYMPHMASVEGDMRVAEHHGHLAIHEVEADPAIGPYNGGKARYDANFNESVALYNRRLVDAFEPRGAEVIHCHDWITVPAALTLRRKTGLPLVFTVHSTEFDRSAGFAPQRWIETIERQGVQGADRVIAVSNYTRGLVVQNYGADPSKVVPVHNGVDLDKYEGAVRTRRQGDTCRILFLSRMSRQKGPLYFLQAARRVAEERPEARFTMAGKGEMLGECIEYAMRRGLADNVRFAGFVPVEGLARFYAAHDAYALPSVSEPFGISILEAMATGLPTLVSKTTGVGEALHHVLRTDYWDTDEMADMMIRLIDSPQLRTELGRNGAREAHKFTWEKCARETSAVYEGAARALAPLAVAA